MNDSLNRRAQAVSVLLALGACLFAAAWLGQNEEVPVGVDDPSADDMLVRASSACFVRITKLEEFDERPSDGDNWVKASFEVIKSSGDIPEFLYIVKNSGGHLAPPAENAPPPIPPRLTHDTLRVGETHWFVFGAEGDGSELPYGMTGWWPSDANDVPKSVVAAVNDDRFKWHPVYDTVCGLVHEWHEDTAQGTVTIRVREDNTQLWSRQFKAMVNTDPNYKTTNVWNFGVSYEMEWPEGEPFLGIQVRLVRTLPADTEFNVPAGTYRVDEVLDMKTGKTLAVWVAAYQTAWVVHAFRQYNSKTGKAITAADMTSLETGGLQAGGGTEDWFRKIEERFEPESGELLSTRTYRFGTVTPPGTTYTETGWIPVEPD